MTRARRIRAIAEEAIWAADTYPGELPALLRSALERLAVETAYDPREASRRLAPVQPLPSEVP